MDTHDLTPQEKKDILRVTQLGIDALKKRLADTERAFNAAKDALEHDQEILEAQKNLLEVYRSMFGLELAEAESGPFAGLGLREAVLAVLRQREGKAITFPQIIEALREADYAIASEHPSRAIHAAIMHVEQVERTGRGLYRWRNVSVPALPGGG